MNISERIKFIRESFCDGSNKKFADKMQVNVNTASNWIGNKRGVGKDVIERIIEKFPEVDVTWLLTGEGEMLKNSTSPSINYDNKGVPYYDVDFLGGFDVIENDQTQNPAYYIDFPEYNRATAWLNITGHSMEPLISHGDMIAVRKLDDWETYILFGEVYAILTDEYRTVKIVRKSANDGQFRLVPINPDFDDQEIPKNIIRAVFQVLGCAKKLM